MSEPYADPKTDHLGKVKVATCVCGVKTIYALVADPHSCSHCGSSELFSMVIDDHMNVTRQIIANTFQSDEVQKRMWEKYKDVKMKKIMVESEDEP